jgi:hypothetical protein
LYGLARTAVMGSVPVMKSAAEMGLANTLFGVCGKSGG